MSQVSSTLLLIDAATIATTATSSSSAIDIAWGKKFSLTYKIASGTSPNVKITFQQSIDGTNWATPENTNPVVANLQDTDLHHEIIEPIIGLRYFRVQVTGNAVSDGFPANGANTVITVNLNIQESL